MRRMIECALMIFPWHFKVKSAWSLSFRSLTNWALNREEVGSMLKKLSKSLWEVLIMYKIMYKVYKKANIVTSAYGQDRTPSRRGPPHGLKTSKRIRKTRSFATNIWPTFTDTASWPTLVRLTLPTDRNMKPRWKQIWNPTELSSALHNNPNTVNIRETSSIQIWSTSKVCLLIPTLANN